MPAAFDLPAAMRHLKRGDPVLKQVIAQVGDCQFKPRRGRFRMLVGSIVSQQISTAAAHTIFGRLQALAAGRITADWLHATEVERLRSAGVSQQKAGYLKDLAQRVVSRQVRLERHGRREDQEVIDELTQIKGIGLWTAQMYLMFSLGRPDILPTADLGIRNAVQRLYDFDDLPVHAEIVAVARPWRPHATVASWYCWRSLEAGSG